VDPLQLDTPARAERTITVSGEAGCDPVEVRSGARVETVANELVYISERTAYFGAANMVMQDGKGGFARFHLQLPLRVTIAGTTGMPKSLLRNDPQAGTGETGWLGAIVRTSDRSYTKIRCLVARESRMTWSLTPWTNLNLFKTIGGEPVPTSACASLRHFLDDTIRKVQLQAGGSATSLDDSRDEDVPAPPPPPAKRPKVERGREREQEIREAIVKGLQDAAITAPSDSGTKALKEAYDLQV
jgi:hypothetical protein